MVKRESGDMLVFVVTLILLGIGVVMVFSASSIQAYREFHDAYYYLKRQLVRALLGALTMIGTMNLDYRVWKRWAPAILFFIVALLVVVLVPGIGVLAGGARRWISLGPVPIEPGEISKLGMIIFMASFLADRREKIKRFFTGFLPPILLLGLVFGLIMLEPSLGMASTVTGIVLVMVFAAGARISHMVLAAFAGLPGFIYVALAEPYRFRRFMAFLHPWKDPLGSGFHIIQSLLALGSGGLFGMGLGRSRQKFLYLPEQHTDFIFAILGEELGFIGTVTIVILFFIFAWRGFRIAMNAPDAFGSLLAVGITSMVAIQATVNIGVVTGSLPITGITLPLMSYGGSSLVITLAGIGILLNISRHMRR